MNTPIEVVSVGQISGGFTNLPVMWLPNRWVFLRGELPGVTGRLAQEVVFDWTGVHASLAAQLKWAIATRCLRGEWCAQTLLQARTLMRHLMPFLRQDASGVASALDRDLETWQIQLRSHLLARGTYRPYTLPALVRSAPEGAKNYTREDPKVRLFRQLYGMIAEELDPRNEYDKDVWNLRRLGRATVGTCGNCRRLEPERGERSDVTSLLTNQSARLPPGQSAERLRRDQTLSGSVTNRTCPRS